MFDNHSAIADQHTMPPNEHFTWGSSSSLPFNFTDNRHLDANQRHKISPKFPQRQFFSPPLPKRQNIVNSTQEITCLDEFRYQDAYEYRNNKSVYSQPQLFSPPIPRRQNIDAWKSNKCSIFSPDHSQQEKTCRGNESRYLDINEHKNRDSTQSEPQLFNPSVPRRQNIDRDAWKSNKCSHVSADLSRKENTCPNELRKQNANEYKNLYHRFSYPVIPKRQNTHFSGKNASNSIPDNIRDYLLTCPKKPGEVRPSVVIHYMPHRTFETPILCTCIPEIRTPDCTPQTCNKNIEYEMPKFFNKRSMQTKEEGDKSVENTIPVRSYPCSIQASTRLSCLKKAKRSMQNIVRKPFKTLIKRLKKTAMDY